MEAAPKLRPKLKQDSIFLPNTDGVLFRNGNNVFFLKGASIYRWISSLAPHLTGEHTLEELCEPLDAPRREMITRLVQTLLEKGIVKNHILEDPALLPETVRNRFTSQIELIDHYADRPVERFTAFRMSRVLLTGSGVPFRALAAGLARNGLETLSLAPTTNADENWRVVGDDFDELRHSGLDTPLTLARVDAARLADEIGKFEFVVYSSDEGSLRDVKILNELCVKAGVKFLPGVVFGGYSLTGPLVKPGVAGCWQCAMLRLSSNLEERRAASLWKRVALGDELAGEPLAAFTTTARMLGNSLAFELFKSLAGYQVPETEGGVLIQDLETLESSRAMLLPHPLCPACTLPDPKTEATQLEKITSGGEDRELTVEAQLQRWYRFLDSHLGIFQNFSDDESVQVPLRTTRLVVGHPAEPATKPLRISAQSIESTAHARYQALREGVRQYARAVPDSRRMVMSSFDELLEDGREPVAPGELSLSSGVHSIDKRATLAWLPASSTFGRRLRYVPAAAVYNDSALNRSSAFENTDAGAAVGVTYRETLTDGLLSALSYERQRDIFKGEGRVASLDAQLLGEMDADLGYLLKTIERMESPTRLLELIGEMPLRVVLAVTGEGGRSGHEIIRVGHGLSRVEATRHALIGIIGTLQDRASQDGETPSDLSYSSERSFRRFSLPADIEIQPLARDSYEDAAASIEDVEAFLQRNGRDALFVNTTADDIRLTETFITGTVLLTS
jgi:putative thiazole-containing bacteriocin maturation protein